MNNKKEAIKKAYGEYYDICKPNENGWCNYDDIGIKVFRALDMYSYNSFCNNVVRPKSLQGIENNNSWISVNDRLPTDNSFYWVFAPKVLSNPFICEFIVEYKEFIENMIYTDLVTHWQPIQVPPKPIY